MKDIKILIITSLAILTACTNSEKNTDFDKGPLLENIAYNLAIPTYENSLQAFQKLDSAIQLMQNKPSESHIQMSRNLWKEASIKWAATAPFNFGPIDELLIENNFQYFPIDSAKLQSALEKYRNSNSVNELGSNIRGLSALEYLLFSESISSYPNRMAFSKMLSHNLVNLNLEILNHWKSNYAKTFTSNIGSNINSSITVLTNQWIEVAENIKNNKIGMPAGKISGFEKNILAAQSPFSNTSLGSIKANLSSLQKSFNGGNGKGVDDYLNALDIRDNNNTLLSERINAQFNTLLHLFPEQNESLAHLIQTNTEKLDEIYLELLNLTILLKTDLMGQLGLITTFSDSDGD